MNLLKRQLYRALTGLVLLFAFSLPALAQEIKIGVVNVNVLMQQAPQAKVAMDALQEEFAPRQRTIVARQKELEDKTAKAKRDLAVMGEAQRRNSENDIRDLQRDLKRMQDEFREDLNLRRNEELGNLQRSLLKEVQDFAEGAGYDLVVGDGVLYTSSTLNITDKVLAAMQKNFKDAGNPDASTPKP